MKLISKLFREQFRAVKNRLSGSGFNIVSLQGSNAKKVQLNFYTSYTTLGVEADHLRLIMHDDDSKDIQEAKREEIYNFNHSINLKKVTVPMAHPSIGFNFFYKDLEEPYVRVTARLLGMPYPNLIESPPFTSEELKELFRLVLKGNETGEDFVNKMIDILVLNHDKNHKVNKTKLQQKESASKASFEKFCEDNHSDYLSLSFDRDKVRSEVDKFEKAYRKELGSTEEYNEVKRLEQELELARIKLRKKGSDINSRMLNENPFVSLVLEYRDGGEDVVLNKIKALYKFHKTLSKSDQSFTKSLLNQSARRIIDTYNSYSEYPFSDFRIDWIQKEYSIKLN